MSVQVSACRSSHRWRPSRVLFALAVLLLPSAVMGGVPINQFLNTSAKISPACHAGEWRRRHSLTVVDYMLLVRQIMIWLIRLGVVIGTVLHLAGYSRLSPTDLALQEANFASADFLTVRRGSTVLDNAGGVARMLRCGKVLTQSMLVAHMDVMLF